MLDCITYTLPAGVIEIEIIDNSFTRRWWPHYQKIQPYMKNSLQLCSANFIEAQVFQQMQ